jgi:Tol biopolymer transport system component
MPPEFPPIRWIHPHSGDWPSFSPDGKQVVFWLDNALYVINSDGTDLHLLYPQKGVPDVGATRPDWSWNPDAIAFTLNTREIWTVHPDGSGAARYCRVPIGWNLYYPSWYRDLSALAAVGYNHPSTQAEIFRLTPDSAEVLTTSPHPCAGRPSVSPDGASIAFAGNEGAYNQVQNQIWIVEPSRPPFRLEPGKDLSALQGRSPNWSPKGDLIVFESTRPAADPKGSPLSIWIIKSDGTDPRPVTDRSLFSASHPEWSRQQTQIVFAARGMGIGIIEV